MKKAVKIIGIVLASLVALVLLVLLGARLFFRIPVNSYYKASEKGFVIPALNDGFVAQGISYDELSSTFLVTGYMTKKTASPLYLVKKDAKKPEKSLKLLLPDGNDYTGHSGGICLAGDYVYVADGGQRRLLVYSYADVKAAADGSGVKAIGEFKTSVSDEDYVKPAFVTSDGKYIIVGEFYREGNYPTPDSHKFTTKAGDYEQALGAAFEIDENAEFGIKAEPSYLFNLPDQVQGMYATGDTVYVSTSWGTSKSHIMVYDRAKLEDQGTIKALGGEYPLLAFDSAALKYDKVIAPMSEEIVIVDGKLYVMCESASNKYVFGKFTSAKWCYATDIDSFFK